MGTIALGMFGGENRKKSDFLLGHGEAAEAQNIDFSSGKFTPFAGVGGVNNLENTVRSIAFFNSAIRPLSYVAETVVAGVPRGGKLLQMLITGEGNVPAVMSRGIDNPKRLGAPWVNVTPVGAVTNIGTASTASAPRRDFFFACSFIMADGSESPPSPLLKVNLGKGGVIGSIQFDVPLVSGTTIPDTNDDALELEYRRGGAVPSGGYPTATDYEAPMAIRLYRGIDSGALHHFVADKTWETGESVGTSRRIEFTTDRLGGNIGYDSTNISTLTAQFVGVETRPRLDMRGILLHPNGFACGYAGNYLCFSAAEQYGIFPRSYETQIPEGDIIAMTEWNGSLFVFVENTPPIIVNLDRPDFADIQRRESAFILHKNQRRTVVNMGEAGVFYAVRQGIVQLPSGRLITNAVINENDFDMPTFAFADADEYFGVRSSGEVLYLTLRGVQPGYVQVGRLDFSGFGHIDDVAVRDDRSIICLGRAEGNRRFSGIFRAGQKLVGKWRSGKFKFAGLQDFGACWIYGGRSTPQSLAHNVYQTPQKANSASPLTGVISKGARAKFFGSSHVLDSQAGRIDINIYVGVVGRHPADISDESRVGFSGGAVRIKLPQHSEGESESVMDSVICDCVINTPAEVGAVSWAQIEIISEREVDYFALAGDREEIVDMKSRVVVYPAPGFVG